MALSYQNYTGDNTTTQFSIPFTYQNTAEISVTVDGVAETGLTFPSSSTVQLTSAPASGTLVQVRRTTNLTARAVDFASGSVLTEEDLDDSNIQVFHAAQESTDLAGDSIQLGNDNKWDAQSSVIKNVGTPTASTDAATKAYTDTEVAGVVSSAVTQATAAATTTAQAEVAAATSTIIPDATKLAIHPIGTQYTLSDGVTTDYSSKHYANVASTNATTATNAASAASTDASTASTAATDAQTAQAAAEAALDTFDDRFLGAKASDPSVDNDGNALLDGAIYFNTTSDIMKVYDATNTVWHDLALTGTDQTNVNLVAGQISPTNNIGTLAGISSDITTVAGNNANVTTVANSISDVNAVGTDIANVNTVATNLTSVNAFADTYFISPTAPASPTLGDLWFDTTNDIMKVYSSSGFVNAGSSVNGTANRYVYTATSGQTSFAATYDAGYVDVYLNGVKLQSGTDFTATDGANVVLTVGAALNDQIDIVGYGTFNIAIPDISGDLTPQLGGNLDLNSNNITGTGNIDVTGTVTANDIAISDTSPTFSMTDTDTNALFRVSASSAVGSVTLEVDENGVGSNPQFLIQGQNVDRFRIDADSGDISFYEDTGTTPKFFWDASAESLGIGTNSPNVPLQVSSAGATIAIDDTSTSIPMLRFRDNGTTIGRVYFTSGDMRFDTNGTSEAMRITSAGNVGIGTSPSEILHIKDSASTNVLIDAPTDNASLTLQCGSSDAGAEGAFIQFIQNTTAKWQLGMNTDNSFRLYNYNTGSEALQVNSSGNVGIGVTPFANNIGNGLDIASGAGMFGSSNSSYLTGNLYYSSGWKYKASAGGALILLDSASSIKFNTAASGTAGGAATLNERMRIDSGGNVVIAKTTTSNTVQGITLGVDGQLNCVIQNAGGASQAIFINRQDATGNAILFRYQNSTVGSIAINASSTSYNTSSDYRLKENVTADWDATTRLKQLNPVRFNFIADADTTVDGFLAHEVQDIVPEAISGTKDGMRDEEYQVSAATGDIYTPTVEATYDEDGVELTAAIDEVIHSADVERPEELAEGQLWRETTAAVMGTRSVPDYQGIDQSKLVPLLVKTIQELEARITALENV